MRKYVAGQLASQTPGAIPVLAINALTGVPLTASLTPEQARKLLEAGIDGLSS